MQLDRDTIEKTIEELIALLDHVDGDCDLEDDELHDDALDAGEDNVLLNPVPIYGMDQTGPVEGWARAPRTRAALRPHSWHSGPNRHCALNSGSRPW